jgi:hypothetical protein
MPRLQPMFLKTNHAKKEMHILYLMLKFEAIKICTTNRKSYEIPILVISSTSEMLDKKIGVPFSVLHDAIKLNIEKNKKNPYVDAFIWSNNTLIDYTNRLKWFVIGKVFKKKSSTRYLGDDFTEELLQLELDMIEKWSKRADLYISISEFDTKLKNPPNDAFQIFNYMIRQYNDAPKINRLIEDIKRAMSESDIIKEHSLAILKDASAQTAFALFHDLEQAQQKNPHTYRAFFRVTDSKELDTNIIDLLIPTPSNSANSPRCSRSLSAINSSRSTTNGASSSTRSTTLPPPENSNTSSSTPAPTASTRMTTRPYKRPSSPPSMISTQKAKTTTKNSSNTPKNTSSQTPTPPPSA